MGPPYLEFFFSVRFKLLVLVPSPSSVKHMASLILLDLSSRGTFSQQRERLHLAHKTLQQEVLAASVYFQALLPPQVRDQSYYMVQPKAEMQLSLEELLAL